MNVWDVLLTVLGWILLVIACFLAVAILLGVLNWIGIAMTRKFKRKPVVRERYTDEAGIMSKRLYMPPEAQAFMAGARWGWGFMHRKGRQVK